MYELTPEEKEKIQAEESFRCLVRLRFEQARIVKRILAWTSIILILAGVVAVVWLSHQRMWFQGGISYHTEFSQVFGLKRWAEVRYLDERIGIVKNLSFVTNQKTVSLRAEIFISRKSGVIVRNDAKVTAEKPLFGPWRLDLNPGSPDSEMAEQGSTLEVAGSSVIQRTLKSLMGK